MSEMRSVVTEKNLPPSLFAHALQRKNGFISLSLWFHLCCTCFSVSVGQIFWRAYIWATAAGVKEQCSVLLVILLWCRSKEEGVEKPKLWLIFFFSLVLRHDITVLHFLIVYHNFAKPVPPSAHTEFLWFEALCLVQEFSPCCSTSRCL